MENAISGKNDMTIDELVFFEAQAGAFASCFFPFLALIFMLDTSCDFRFYQRSRSVII